VDTLFRFNGSRKVNLFQARLPPKSNAPSVSNNFHHLKPTSYPSRHSWTISELQSSLTPPILWFLFPWRPSGISVQFLSEKASSYQKQPIRAFQPGTLNAEPLKPGYTKFADQEKIDKVRASFIKPKKQFTLCFSFILTEKFDGLVKSLQGRHSRESGSP